VVTHHLQVERRTGKVRRPETDVLPLCHATNLISCSETRTVGAQSVLNTCIPTRLFTLEFANWSSVLLASVYVLRTNLNHNYKSNWMGRYRDGIFGGQVFGEYEGAGQMSDHSSVGPQYHRTITVACAATEPNTVHRTE